MAYNLEHAQRDEHPDPPLQHPRPGLVASKKPAKGAASGFIIGGLVGAVPGAAVGMLLFGGAAGMVVIVCFAVAGSIFGGAFGGIPGGSSRPLLGQKRAGL